MFCPTSKEEGEAPSFSVDALLRQPSLSGARHHARRYHRHTDEATLDNVILRDVQHDLYEAGRSRRQYAISNRDRAVGSRLAGYLAKKLGDEGLPDHTIRLSFDGYAGQSFGVWALPGTTLVLNGVANDYVGKGLAGGTLILCRPEESNWDDAPLLGNVALYGATAGTLLAAGSAGERFAVRNSGATAVVEGVGAHGCEYMTGGTVVVLGAVGRNFAAGMTGGRAFVYDPENRLQAQLNPEFVVLAAPSAADWGDLHALVSLHAEETGSACARQLLGAWNATRGAWKLVTQSSELLDESKAQSETAVALPTP